MNFKELTAKLKGFLNESLSSGTNYPKFDNNEIQYYRGALCTYIAYDEYIFQISFQGDDVVHVEFSTDFLENVDETPWKFFDENKTKFKVGDVKEFIVVFSKIIDIVEKFAKEDDEVKEIFFSGATSKLSKIYQRALKKHNVEYSLKDDYFVIKV